MAGARTYIADFALASPLYALASVSVFAVDPVTQKASGTLAPLYSDPYGPTTLANPQALDGEGKWLQPVYVDQPVIMQISNAGAANMQTGIIGSFGLFRGAWAPGVLYATGDTVRDGDAALGTGNVYYCNASHLSGVFTDDLAAGKWQVYAASPNLLKFLLDNTPAVMPAADSGQILSILNLPGGGSGVVANLRAYTTIRGAANAFGWSVLGVVDFAGTGGTGQHVGVYGQGIRRTGPLGGAGNPEIWGQVSQAIDMTNSKTSLTAAMLTHEMDLTVNHVDDANARQGIVQVLGEWTAIVDGGYPAEAYRAYGTTTSVYGAFKKTVDIQGNYTVSAIDTRSAFDNGKAAGAGPVVTETVSGSTNVLKVSNVMPFTSDRSGNDVNAGHQAVVTINGLQYTQTGYAFTGNGPAGTITLFGNVTISDGTLGNPVRNGSHTIWLGAGQEICLCDVGTANVIYYDAGTNSIAFKQGTTQAFRVNSANATFHVPAQLHVATVGTLPAVTSGDRGTVAFALNARNTGEGAAAGTGCLVCVNNNGIWTSVWSGVAPTI